MKLAGGVSRGATWPTQGKFIFIFFYSPFFLITFNRSTCNSVSVYLYAFVILNSPELASLLLVGPNIWYGSAKVEKKQKKQGFQDISFWVDFTLCFPHSLSLSHSWLSVFYANFNEGPAKTEYIMARRNVRGQVTFPPMKWNALPKLQAHSTHTHSRTHTAAHSLTPPQCKSGYISLIIRLWRFLPSLAYS